MSIRVKAALLLVLAIAMCLLAYPKETDLLSRVGIKNVNLGIKQGLDLKGGAQLVFEADLSKTTDADKNRAVTGLIEVIQRRANPTGTAEVNVVRQGSNRVNVELPGVSDPAEAIDRIGRTANLMFVETSPDGTELPTGIEGKDIDSATADFSVQSSQPVVSLRLKGDAVKRFGDLTTKLSKEGKLLTTYLDDQIVFGPATVSSPITDGNAELQGNFKDIKEAKKIAEQITAGALPVPVALVEQRSVGPSLGQESIEKSLLAGAIGLICVALFMIFYYRAAGVMAVLALMLYTLITISIFKLSTLTPYTIVLTLAGIAGFILSIGMAVDANILIFERFKEELRRGKSLRLALEAGFDRAWTAIRDSNVTTLISCFVLYIFGPPIVKGFAVTLSLGVLISMFSAIVVTRTLMRLLVKREFAENHSIYGHGFGKDKKS